MTLYKFIFVGDTDEKCGNKQYVAVFVLLDISSSRLYSALLAKAFEEI